MNIYNQGEQIDRVVTTKSGTTVFITSVGDSRAHVMVPKRTYLADEQGKRYYVKSAKGIKIGKRTALGTKRSLSYQLSFAPLPKGTVSFDMVQETTGAMGAFLNIHQHGTKPRFSVDANDQFGLNGIQKVAK